MTVVSIQDAMGSGYYAQVNNSGAMLVTGSIAITNPAVNVDVNVSDFISVTPSGIFYVTASGAGTHTVLGSVAITSGFLTGSVNIATPIVQTGSVAITSSTLLSISGVNLAGSFSITNQPVSILGSTAITSGFVNGSIAITGMPGVAIDEEGRRSPNFGFSGALLTTSGLTKNIYIPDAGSKAMLKWITISSDVANYVAIKFSGNTTTPIVQFFIPASGTVVQNFVGGEPSGPADCPVSAGIGVAGNIYISAGVRSSP